MTPTQIKNRYFGRMKKVLQNVRAKMVAADVKCGEVCDESMDSYKCSLACFPSGNPKKPSNNIDFNIDFEIMESEPYDGTKGGVAFGTSIVYWGGSVMGNCTPYNFTSSLWVPRKDRDAIEARFVHFEKPEFVDDMIAFIEECQAT